MDNIVLSKSTVDLIRNLSTVLSEVQARINTIISVALYEHGVDDTSKYFLSNDLTTLEYKGD